MKNPWLIPVATLVVGGLGGYFAGRNNGSGEEAGEVKETGTSNTRAAERMQSLAEASGAKRSMRGSSTNEIVRRPGSNSRIEALIDFYAGLSPDQLEAEAAKLEALPMNERFLASFLLFGRWGESDPMAALSFANTMGFAGMFVRPTVLQSWASVDPANAAKYYAANPREFSSMGMMGGGRGPMGGQTGASVIAAEWAKQDPEAALSWAKTLGTDKAQAMESILGEVAKKDPKQAAEMIAGLDGNLGPAYGRIASEYGASDFDQAQAWIRTLPAAEQDRALASAIAGLSNKDPQAAAEQVLAMAPGERRDRAVEEVVEDLARVDPQLGADFLKKQNSEGALREGMRELMPSWVAKNPVAALSFANSYSPGPVRDSAIQAYVFSNQSGEPEELMKVAETITDEGDRARSMAISASRWMREDEAAAKTYIGQSTALSEEAKTRIIEGQGDFGGRPRWRRD